ncbi:cytochrome c [Leadbetterella sp. DM7]|uniref:c-type cytochrome n=1 Tax=Leadbetterella sp. DM7 TaxID=3235085 RepID=UPI00349EB29F
MKTLKKTGLILAGLVTVILAAALLVLFLYFPNVDPAPDLKVELTPEKIKRGEYLANSVTVCMDCHSQRDWESYAGPPKPGTLGMGGELFAREFGFPGIFYSKNITPFALKDWTDGEIYRTITSGVNREGEALFPVMPFHLYSRLHDDDIHSIIAYLRTLPPIENTVPERTVDFPFNLILRTLPIRKSPVGRIPPKSDPVAYGAYMTTAAGCIECHTPVKDGQLIEDQVFSGGREFAMPGGTLISPNITPDETGLGHWTADQFVQTFKQYQDSTWKSPRLTVNDPNTLMPWIMYSHMEEDDLRAIFAYLQTLPPVSRTVQKFSGGK